MIDRTDWLELTGLRDEGYVAQMAAFPPADDELALCGDGAAVDYKKYPNLALIYIVDAVLKDLTEARQQE